MRRGTLGLAVVAPILVLVVYAAGALHWYVPFLTEKRPAAASTPSLQPLFSIKAVTLQPGSRACIRPLSLDRRVAMLQMILRSLPQDAPSPVSFTLSAPGYEGRGRFGHYPVGGAATVTARVSPAPPRAVDGTLCLHNDGRRPVGLVGTDEPQSITLPSTSVDGGRARSVDPAVTFLEAPATSSLLARRSVVLERASAFTGLTPTWLLWLLAIALLVGTPAGAAVALWFGLRDRN